MKSFVPKLAAVAHMMGHFPGDRGTLTSLAPSAMGRNPNKFAFVRLCTVTGSLIRIAARWEAGPPVMKSNVGTWL